MQFQFGMVEETMYSIISDKLDILQFFFTNFQDKNFSCWVCVKYFDFFFFYYAKDVVDWPQFYEAKLALLVSWCWTNDIKWQSF